MTSITPITNMHISRLWPYLALNHGAIHQMVLMISSRHFSKKTAPLKYVPHQFSMEEAAKRFAENDQNRVFAPIQLNQTTAFTIHVNPLKKILIPIFGVEATITRTDFKGKRGYYRVVTEHYWENNALKTRTRTVTDWFDISGFLIPRSFSQNKQGMTIYGGLSYDPDQIEQAMEGFNNKEDLLEFDVKSKDVDTIVDPFLKRAAIAQEIGYNRITSYEEQRAIRYIKEMTGADDARVDYVSITYDSFKLSSLLLPAYILQYADVPPLVMPAFKNSVKIIGPSPLSVTKLMTVSGVAATVLSLLFPQVAFPLRLAMIIASSAVGGLWAKFSLSLKIQCNKQELKKQV